jgi:integrase
MAKEAFRIRPYAHPRLKFVVASHLAGRRERRFFETKREAETYVELKSVELLNQGVEGATFSSELRVLARRAATLLEPFGKTVLDAAEFYAQHLRRISASCKVAEVVEEMLGSRAGDGLSEDYLADLKIKYRAFAHTFGDRMIADIAPKEISGWLRHLNVGAVSRNTIRSRLTTLFSFAKRQGYTSHNPIMEVDRAKERGGEIGILSVADAARLMDVASPETLPYWAIGAFAGLRSAEIERLDWGELDLESGLIEVKASKAKTASRRLVQIQPNLRRWLAPYGDRRGKVCPSGLRKRLEADRQKAALLENWPSNALRHSYGSYHLAHFKDTAALALQMGNSPAIIFQHYRELVKPKDAARYWEIAPGMEAEKVVAFPAATAT